jgi:uncharacterized protein YqgC (DUF456 family)
MPDYVLWGAVIVLVATGMVGIILPGLPGTILVFAGFFLAAWIDDFARVGWITISILAFLTVVSFMGDFAVTAAGSKRIGASKKAMAGAAIGTIVGLIFGLPGLIIGPFLGAAIGEYYERGDLIQAGRAGLGTWMGIIFGVILKLALAFVMIGIFLFAYFL